MPPKRTRPSRAAAPKPTTLPSPAPPKRAKRTPAAKPTPAPRKSTRTKPTTQNRAQNDTEIRSAFDLFSLSRDSVSDPDALSDEDDEDGDGEEGVIKISDVRRALNACNLPKPPPDFFDEEQRYLSWRHFLELGRTLREMAGDDDDDDDDDEDEEEEEEEGGAEVQEEDGGGGGFIAGSDDGEEEGDIQNEDDEEEAGGFTKPVARPRRPKAGTTDTSAAAKPKASRKRKSAAIRSQEEEQEELNHAFSLFTHSTTRTHITLQDLRRVAKELREEVDDKILMLMIEEANGEEGRQSVSKGVGKEEFEGVMRRAGVFG